MRELKRASVLSLRPDPGQPRKQFDEADLLALSKSMKDQGQLIPLIVHNGTIWDGERRWKAAQLAEITELDVIEASSRAELPILQLTIDVHRINLSPMERSDALAKIKREQNWSVGELAERLHMRQPQVSKLLKFQEGCDELRAALKAGRLDQDKAHAIISQQPDHAMQRELLKNANDLTREQLRAQARSNGQPVELKAAVARFQPRKGVIVTVSGPRMNLLGAIDVLAETLKTLRKAQTESLDLVTVSRVMRDRALAAH